MSAYLTLLAFASVLLVLGVLAALRTGRRIDVAADPLVQAHAAHLLNALHAQAEGHR